MCSLTIKMDYMFAVSLLGVKLRQKYIFPVVNSKWGGGEGHRLQSTRSAVQQMEL